MAPRKLIQLLLLLAMATFRIARADDQVKSSIKVVMAGFPRSGSLSLSQALDRLGYKTCHGKDLVYGATGKFKGVLEALAGNRIVEALDLSEEAGCEAIFEFHSPYWREIRELRPDAKFVVIVRDYERWENSISALLGVLSPMFRYPLRLLPPFSLIRKFNVATAGGLGIGTVEDGEYYLLNPKTESARQIRKRAHEEFVKDSHEFLQQEPGRALLFNMKDGYKPICDFLGIEPAVDCPNEPFPHANSSVEVKKTALIFYTLQIVAFVAPILALWAIALGCKWLYKAMGKSISNKQKRN